MGRTTPQEQGARRYSILSITRSNSTLTPAAAYAALGIPYSNLESPVELPRICARPMTCATSGAASGKDLDLGKLLSSGHR